MPQEQAEGRQVAERAQPGPVRENPTPERPALAYQAVRYRVKARDAQYGGEAHVTPWGSQEQAWSNVDWMKAQGSRFSLVRIEASREALIG